ncbi:hypothetical protein OAA10_00275 [bacterium]|nr:hypothetical protein [bacterium]
MISVICVDEFDVVPEQHKQIRLRLDPTTLQRAQEIQELLTAAGKHSSLETVVGMAIEALHDDLLSHSSP